MSHSQITPSQQTVIAALLRQNFLQKDIARALCITNKCDIIQLPKTIQGGWDWIQKHYGSLGLGCTENVLWSSDFEKITELPEYDFSVFMFTQEVNRYRSNTRWLEIVKSMNSKNNFARLCKEVDVPFPKTKTCSSRREFLKSSDVLSYPFYLKADVSVSGLGVAYCSEERDFLKILNEMGEDDAFQLQEVVCADSFLNVQYKIESDILSRVAITRQLLNGSSHKGNVFPSEHGDSVWNITDSLAEYVYANGMLGYFAFDVAVVGDKFLAIECNPRFNGSTYPTVAAKKMDIASWMATNLSVKARSFDSFSLGDLEYSSSTNSGVIVINWGGISDGNLGILIAGDSISEQEEILREMKIKFG